MNPAGDRLRVVPMNLATGRARASDIAPLIDVHVRPIPDSDHRALLVDPTANGRRSQDARR